MRWPALALALALVAFEAGAQEAQQTTVDDLVDMAGDFGIPFFLYLRPLQLSVGASVERGRAASVAELSWLGVRVGRRWGRLDLAQLDATVIGTPEQAGGAVGGTLLDLKAQFLCHDADDAALRWMWPIASDLITPPRCRRGEWLGYFLQLGRINARVPSGRIALRIAEGGVLFDLLAHGRSVEVWRNRVELRVGAASDVVWFGNSNPGGWDAAARGLVGLRAVGSTDDRRWRASLEVTWRPNFARLDDHLVDAAATLGTFFVPNPNVALLLGVRGRLAAATNPRMTANPWADPGKPITGVVDLVAELWWLGS